jgi:hypothetical protein
MEAVIFVAVASLAAGALLIAGLIKHGSDYNKGRA